MRKINHINWSFGISLFIFYFLFEFEIYKTLVFSFLVSIISWLPDIDIRIVNYSHKLLKSSYYLLFPVHILVKLLFKHRTWTHSIFIPIILSYICFKIGIENYFYYPLIILSLALGLHIFEDTLTISGVNIFWPIKFKIKLGSFSTSSHLDFIILEIIGYIIILSFGLFIFFI